MSVLATLASPFRQTYRTLQCHAHENPVFFYSIILGCIGPVMVATVPPIRKRMGWKPAELVPSTYPIPQRQRREVKGYEDEE